MSEVSVLDILNSADFIAETGGNSAKSVIFIENQELSDEKFDALIDVFVEAFDIAPLPSNADDARNVFEETRRIISCWTKKNASEILNLEAFCESEKQNEYDGFFEFVLKIQSFHRN